MKKFPIVISVLLVTGCAGTSHDPRFRTLTLSEADSYRQQLMSAYVPSLSVDEDLFLQPKNKTEACLVKIGNKNDKILPHKIFWIGSCSNGYASGEGRLIAFNNDKSRSQTITTLNENHNPSGPTTFINFTRNLSFQGVVKEEPQNRTLNSKAAHLVETKNNNTESYRPKLEGMWGQIVPYKDSRNKATLLRSVGEFDPSDGPSKYIEMSSTSLVKFLRNRKDGYVVELLDLGGTFPTDVPSRQTLARVMIRSYDGAPGGVGAIKLRSGEVIPVFWHGERPERVNVAPSYLNSLSQAISESEAAVDTGAYSFQLASRAFSDYVEKNCTNKQIQVPKGITKTQYFEFCSYFATQSKKVNEATKDYQKELAREKEQADKLLAVNTEKFRQEEEHLARMAVYRSKIMEAHAQANAANRMATATESMARQSQSSSYMIQQISPGMAHVMRLY